jgi:hypothetical protein
MKINAALRRRATNITLSPRTLAKLDALALYKEASGEPKPSRAWMVEQGVALFLDKIAKRGSSLRRAIEEIDEQYKRMAIVTRLEIGNGSVHHLHSRNKRKAL